VAPGRPGQPRVTQVRQRISRQLHGRRGIASDKVWASRQLLLTGYEHLSPKQRARFKTALAVEDPTNEIGAAHAVKERLRLLLAEHEPHLIRRRLYDFYHAAAPTWLKLVRSVDGSDGVTKPHAVARSSW